MNELLSIKESPWVIALVFLMGVLLFFMAGCGHNIKEINIEEEKSMSQERSPFETQIPPIDLKIPEKLETATFALG